MQYRDRNKIMNKKSAKCDWDSHTARVPYLINI